VARRIKNHQIASRQMPVHILSDLLAGDDVLLALEDQRACRHPRKVAAIVRLEGHPRKLFGYFRIGTAEAVGQFLTKFRTVRVA